MRYFITGGFGLIGSALTNSVKGDITILSRSNSNRERIKRSGFTVILKELSKVTLRNLEGVDVIYHCASTVDNYNVLTDPYIDIKTNLNGTIHLLELCKKLKKKPKFIYLSTFFVYGNAYEKTHIPVDEETKTDPLAIYPATKLCAENIIKLYSRLYDIPYIICRLTNVYGEHESFTNKKKGALNYLIMKAVKNEEIAVYKDGNYYRDYIYTDDVVSALLFLEKKVENDLFLVGFGSSVRFKEIIKAVIMLSKSKSLIKKIDPPGCNKIVGTTDFIADTTKLNKLGWTAKIDYKEGLEKIINRYKTII